MVERFTSYSQAMQDEFVVRVLNGMKHGRFIDIGAGDPRNISNTYALETEFGWTGIACDKETEQALRDERKGSKVFGDAFAVDWQAECSALAVDGRIEYLSLDIEPPSLTLAAMLLMPFDRTRFSVVTVEHDMYRTGRSIRAAMRGILSEYGYERVASDVCVIDACHAYPFEDWWVDPIAVSVDHARAVILDMGVPRAWA